jgi:hypothetical protein
MAQKRKSDQIERISYKLGNLLEEAIGSQIHRRYEAPVLNGFLKRNVWYRVPIQGCTAGDGSEYHIYIKKADPKKLCVFLSGGGVAWNEYTAARPATGGKIAAGLPNYYWNNLRPFTQMMNINTGITETGNVRNPFDDWSFIVITYATGDFHIGSSDFPYVGEDGQGEVLHFCGHKNFRAGMKEGSFYITDPVRLMIAGDSAGAFAVPALADEIMEEFYPSCKDVTLFSDSGQLLYRQWRKTVRDVWGADQKFWKPLHSDNPVVDWYGELYRKYGNRIRYLYASSTHDYLLSAYYNDVAHKVYATDAEVQELFYKQLKVMIKELHKAVPEMGFFIYNWKNHRFHLGGTVHTAVRHLRFYFNNNQQESMARWLYRAVHGKVENIGLFLLR